MSEPGISLRDQPTAYGLPDILAASYNTFQRITKSILAGNCCRVLGPRFRGKSKLVRETATVYSPKEPTIHRIRAWPLLHRTMRPVSTPISTLKSCVISVHLVILGKTILLSQPWSFNKRCLN